MSGEDRTSLCFISDLRPSLSFILTDCLLLETLFFGPSDVQLNQTVRVKTECIKLARKSIQSTGRTSSPAGGVPKANTRAMRQNACAWHKAKRKGRLKRAHKERPALNRCSKGRSKQPSLRQRAITQSTRKDTASSCRMAVGDASIMGTCGLSIGATPSLSTGNDA